MASLNTSYTCPSLDDHIAIYGYICGERLATITVNNRSAFFNEIVHCNKPKVMARYVITELLD